MKERVAIFLMLVYLFGSTNACQLLKMPQLISHYLQHKKQAPNITFGSFFKMHYVDAQPFDADYAQDMQLPFKTTPDTFCRNTPTIVSSLPNIVFKAPVFSAGMRPVLNDNIPPALLIYTIFQPPRA